MKKTVLHFIAAGMMICFFVQLCPAKAQDNNHYYRQGLYFKRFGMTDKAIEAFSKVIAADPDHADAYYSRGMIWHLKKEWQKAVKDYSKAIELKPDVVSFYINRAAAWFQSGDFQKTISDYDHVVKLDPDSADTFNNRGMVWCCLGEYDKAIKDHSKAIMINPGISKYYTNRGAAWFSKTSYDRAIVDYTTALALDPTSYDALKNRGIVWFEKGFYDRALKDYDKSLYLYPHAAELLISRGVVYYQTGDYSKALLDFVDAVSNKPDNVEALSQLAWMLSVCPDEEFRNGRKALEMAEKAIKQHPSLNTLETLAVALAGSGDFEQAVIEQEKLILLAKERLPHIPKNYQDQLEAYKKKNPWRIRQVQPEITDNPYPVGKKVAVSVANVRVDPSIQSFVIKQYQQDQTIPVIGKQGQWFLAEIAENQFGWMFERVFVSTPQTSPGVSEQVVRKDLAPPEDPVVEEKTRQVDRKVEVIVAVGRIREKPSPAARIQYRVVKGNKLTLLNQTGNWYQVWLGPGKTGWGHKSLFKD